MSETIDTTKEINEAVQAFLAIENEPSELIQPYANGQAIVIKRDYEDDKLIIDVNTYLKILDKKDQKLDIFD